MNRSRSAVLLLLAGCGCGLPQTLHAQQDTARSPSYVFEIQTRQRWIHGGQRPRFTPHQIANDWLTVDSVRGVSQHERTMFVSGSGMRRGDTGWIRFSRDAGARDVAYRFAEREPLPFTPPRMNARLERTRLFSGFDGFLRLPEFQLHQLVPPAIPGRAKPGEAWTDTIAIAAQFDGFEQVIEGRLVRRLLGDTVVAGRQLQIVLDSALIRYRERWLRDERTLDTQVVIERNAAGSVITSYLYEPATALYRVREDSASLAGTAVLRYPDGRGFRTPARYEGTQRIELVDPDEHRERQEARRADLAAARGGMILYPSTPVTERLAAGDSTVRDSLLEVLRSTDDPDERQSRWRQLQQWWRGSESIDAVLEQAAGVDADTTYQITTLQRSFYRGAGRQFDAATLRRALPYMADPGLTFRHDAPLDPFYENPRHALLLHPPAASEDTADWACTPAACRLLAEQVHSPGDPRLRALGLIAAFVLDPARYASQVVERADAGEPLLGPAAELARGIPTHGNTAIVPVPLPGRSADWRAWLHWLNPPLATVTRSGRLPFEIPERPFPPHFGERHVAAVRVRERIDGRDIAQELTNRRGTETTDSALLVYDVLLLGMGELQPQPENVARLLQSDSEVARMRGRLALQYLFRDPQPVTDDTAAELIGQLLASYLDGAEWWPRLPDLERATRARRAQASQRADSTVFVLRDGLPSAVIEVWRDRVQIVSVEDWNARPLRAAATLVTIGQLQRVGPFIRLSLTQETRHARGPHEAAGGWASGDEYTLMQTQSGWVIVDTGGWIT